LSEFEKQNLQGEMASATMSNDEMNTEALILGEKSISNEPVSRNVANFTAPSIVVEDSGSQEHKVQAPLYQTME